MRPLPGSEAHPSAANPRSRKPSIDHAAASSSNVPTAFFLKREDELEQSLATSGSSDVAGRSQENTFGVQSLADTLEVAFGQQRSTAKVRRESGNSTEGLGKAAARSPSHSSLSGPVRPLESARPPLVRKLKTQSSASTPLIIAKIDTPSSIPPSAMPSTPTSVSLHSLKLSDEESTPDEVASQAIASSGEEDEEEEAEIQQEASGSFPQLVMPRIQMPIRRPFTTKGKSMGKLKVMVAGQRGVGKTSLIRSILQLCEHIVHVDPVSPSHPATQTTPGESKTNNKSGEHARKRQITEINASTKPCPHWRTEVEENRRSRRRKSSHDTILERNICFVDTPGFLESSTEKNDMDLVIDYLESLFCQTSSVHTLEDSEILGLVSGIGGVSVDVVFYLLSPNEDIARDIEFMQRLSTLTNVMPVIGKSDTLSAQDVVALKLSTLARLQTTPVKPFFFGKALDDALLAVQSLSLINTMPRPADPSERSFETSQSPFNTPTYPYAISSTPVTDNDIMDASVLMSSGYIQPLLPSELTTLVDQVFNPDSIAWLRHSAAKKYLTWRRRTQLPGDSFVTRSVHQRFTPRTSSIELTGINVNASATSSIFSLSSPSGVLVPQSGSPLYTSNLDSPSLDSPFSLANSGTLDCPADFSLTRFRNYTHSEQHLAEVRISKWATDLQRSLRNERDRFEDLQRTDRAKWLLERVGEEVSRGTIVTSPGSSPRAGWAVVRHGDDKVKKTRQHFKKSACLDSRDPLGLCDFSDGLKRRGFVLVKFLGGMSVLGAVVVGVIRACGMETGLPQNGWWSFVRGWVMGSSE